MLTTLDEIQGASPHMRAHTDAAEVHERFSQRLTLVPLASTTLPGSELTKPDDFLRKVPTSRHEPVSLVFISPFFL